MEAFFSLENRYLAADLHHLHSARRASFVRHAGELSEDAAGDRRQHRCGTGAWPHLFGKWPNLASAYITGISVGILVRSPAFWPYAIVQRDLDHVEVCVARERAAHLESVELRHFRHAVSGAGDRGDLEHSVGQLSFADDRDLGAGLGDHLARAAVSYHRRPMWRRFIAFAFLRSWITGSPWQSEIAPITGPMYQLFIFFMITDPKTTVRSKTGQCIVVFLVALVEMVLRLHQVVYAPFYALFIVGPAALLIEMWLDSRRAPTLRTLRGTVKPVERSAALATTSIESELHRSFASSIARTDADRNELQPF